jgi:glycosyltransferase involved in cell wall biosynthesis
MINSQKLLAIYLPTLIGGGAERVMLNLASGFVNRGYQVDLVLAQCEGAFVSQIPDSLNLVELNRVHVNKGRTILSLPSLVRYIRRERPIALLSGLHANIIAIWAKRLAGVPVRLVICEHSATLFKYEILSSWFSKFYSLLMRWNYPLADELVAVSEGLADDLSTYAKIPRDRIIVIANPIITPEVVSKAKEVLDHPWFKLGEPPVILAVGRLVSQKDYKLLINAFARIRQFIPVRLLILGEGPEREELASLVKKLGLDEVISLPGFIHNPYSFMVHASVFVLSSRFEGLPTVLAEALYCGTPLVATDCPSGPREILHGGQYGKLVPVGDEECLAQAILTTLNSDRVQSPKESWQPFEMDYVVDQYLRVIFGDL